jgi:hypothetical protein
MSKGKRIPIASVKKLSKELGYTQMIIVAFDGETGICSVATWGRSLTDSAQAAQGGNFVKRALNWPAELCNTKPARVKRMEGITGKKLML